MKLFWPQNGEFEVVLKKLGNQQLLSPFDDEVVRFTQSLSKRLLQYRQIPEIVALGFWLRKTNVQSMKENWETEKSGKVIKARGTVFHIAPSNVDTIFVYSWMLSLLAGNRNIIRISSKEKSNPLLDAIILELSRPEFEKIANMTIICTYSYEEKATKILSSICHTRVVWGGDTTVQTIRQIPLASMANELVFPDRFSLAAFSSEVVLTLDEENLEQLLEQFYNDVFWFDQMACSSPRLVVWSGEKIAQAKTRFWKAFERKVYGKRYELMAANQVLKYSTSLWLSVNKEVSQINNKTYFSRIQLTDFSPEVRERHCGGGVFFEYHVNKLIDIASIIIDKDQTLAYFGYEKEELIELVQKIPTRGLDRVVPIGQALNFDGVWDGQSFINSFTREVTIL
ncbi:acyl-CoA reductase LuxC [Ureibacillus xyleni]|uniref:Acyl-CoA reductase LuxC n=1 Tax=Ureibacillus xyleni TaxID=614648 RepID=A0A285RB45_9BACL|nr:acyl-CoA reductase [Ureibacillus xyleni]SOB91326.1 acyl-CoA reductase LuxC [Ureibacillus xyleni]